MTFRRRYVPALARRTTLGITVAVCAMAVIVGGALLGLFVWLALGRPELPSPESLTVDQVSNIVKACLGIAAGTAAIVALVVAYRKQRDAEDRREADALHAALDDLGSENLFTRVAGIYALRDLADRYEGYRQRCIDLICMALVHTQDANRQDVRLRDAICEVLQSRLSAGDNSWGAHEFVLSGGRASGINLTNIRLTGGMLALRTLSVDASGLDLSGLVLDGGARLEISNVHVAGTLRIDQFLLQSRTHIDCVGLSIEAGGTLSLGGGSEVESGAEFTMSRTWVHSAASISAPDLRVRGSVRSRHLVADKDAQVDFAGLHCSGGSVTFGTVDLDEGAAFILAHSTIAKGSALRVDECFARGGSMHANNIRLTDRSALLLRHGFFSNGAFLNVSGLRNGSASLTGVDANIEQAAAIAIEGCENEGEGSVFFLRATMHGGEPEVRLRAGGNYGAHSHISLETLHNRPDAGLLKLAPPLVMGGEVDFRVEEGIDLRLDDRYSKWRAEGAMKLTLEPQHREVLSCAETDTDPISCDFWANHVAVLPNGTKLNGYDGSREFAADQIKLARSARSRSPEP